jgi:hypothetical protein
MWASTFVSPNIEIAVQMPGAAWEVLKAVGVTKPLEFLCASI